eukprot:CAMPEP_0197044734 /NCGR_PEP_ID=MMETSP1384-20130603/20726_1 /TAXON_ID=29189 /ORGANISM="Ammonia sp." /LENGTH=355 /DNA_ID=CAMNT_0042476243 /DNA_START=24 /DNA_END=1091 /DNA_ORIENTATION=-
MSPSSTVFSVINAFCLAFVSQTSAQSDMCLWGIDTSLSIFHVNGLYRYAGINSAVGGSTERQTYYRLDRTSAGCGDYGYLYLYYDESYSWLVTVAPYGNVITYGNCDAVASNPSDCTSWTFGNTAQSNAAAYLSDCPQKECASITVTASVQLGNCDYGTYTQIGRNMFQSIPSGQTEFVWWFNPLTFQWICSKLKDYSGNVAYATDSAPDTDTGYCASSLTVTLGDTAGRQLSYSDGYDGPFNGGHTDAAASGVTYTFTCNDASSATTYTKQPTAATAQPALSPITPSPLVGGTPAPTTPSPASSPSASSPAAAPSNGGDGTVPTPAPTESSSANTQRLVIICSIFALCLSVFIV